MRATAQVLLAMALALARCQASEASNAVLACDGACTSPTLGEVSNAGLKFGVAANFQADRIYNNQAIKDLMVANFANGGVMTDENACKVMFTQPSQGTFTFTNCDRSFQFAKDNGMEFRLHTLVWDKQIGNWMKAVPKEELEDVMKTHIQTVLQKYPEAKYIDVVNEAHRARTFNPWKKKIDDVITKAFQFAQEVRQPGQLLVINENSADEDNFRSDKLFKRTKKLKALGLVDAVGLQMHLKCSQIQNGKRRASISRNLRRFNNLGVDIHLTEIDIRSCGNEKNLARAYERLTNMCLKYPRCKIMQFWGPADPFSWKNVNKNKVSSVLPFDKNLQARDATLKIVQAALDAAP